MVLGSLKSQSGSGWRPARDCFLLVDADELPQPEFVALAETERDQEFPHGGVKRRHIKPQIRPLRVGSP